MSALFTSIPGLAIPGFTIPAYVFVPLTISAVSRTRTLTGVGV